MCKPVFRAVVVFAVTQAVSAAATEQEVAEAWFRSLTVRQQAAQRIVVPSMGKPAGVLAPGESSTSGSTLSALADSSR